MSTQYVTLLGTEDLRRAASAMTEAAAEMQRAAQEVHAAVQHLDRVLYNDRMERQAALEAQQERERERQDQPPSPQS